MCIIIIAINGLHQDLSVLYFTLIQNLLIIPFNNNMNILSFVKEVQIYHTQMSYTHFMTNFYIKYAEKLIFETFSKINKAAI